MQDSMVCAWFKKRERDTHTHTQKKKDNESIPRDNMACAWPSWLTGSYNASNKMSSDCRCKLCPFRLPEAKRVAIHHTAPVLRAPCTADGTFKSKSEDQALKAEGPRFDTASALLSLQKGCSLWTVSCDFVHHFLLKH